jgi:hypothetical protein
MSDNLKYELKVAIFPEPTQVQLHGGKNPIVLHQEMNCNLSCTSALSLLQLPAPVQLVRSPLPEHETFWRNTSYMNSEDIKMKGNSPKGFDVCKGNVLLYLLLRKNFL